MFLFQLNHTFTLSHDGSWFFFFARHITSGEVDFGQTEPSSIDRLWPIRPWPHRLWPKNFDRLVNLNWPTLAKPVLTCSNWPILATFSVLECWLTLAKPTLAKRVLTNFGQLWPNRLWPTFWPTLANFSVLESPTWAWPTLANLVFWCFAPRRVKPRWVGGPSQEKVGPEGSPEGWGPEGWGPERWGPKGWGPKGWGART